jgi:23S rRNA (pseudouridine1915-N3)-methyltransferase
MNINLLAVGKTDADYLNKAIEVYQKRLGYYTKFSLQIIPDVKNAAKMSHEEQRRKEGELLLAQLENSSYTVLLDAGGKEFTSVEFSKWLQAKFNSGFKNVNFVIGGPYGFSKDVYSAANEKISLSKMTFSHQMVRMIFLEQLYRAFTILNNEPYHHE